MLTNPYSKSPKPTHSSKQTFKHFKMRVAKSAVWIHGLNTNMIYASFKVCIDSGLDGIKIAVSECRINKTIIAAVINFIFSEAKTEDRNYNRAFRSKV